MAPKEKAAAVDPGKAAHEYVNPTPKGELKPMNEPMASAYSPHEVEASWSEWWEASGYFKCCTDPDDKRPTFSICLPPPNVTGSLHLGHALTAAVQDLLIRWHRMRGYNTLWIPGTDHAGIATQVVVEKKIWKEEQKTRHDVGREEFVKKVWVWKEAYGDRITMQLRRMGCSLDWDMECFTMDEIRGKAVQAAFIQFYEDGLIYRDVRLTNWCCQLNSAIADIEVDYLDIEKRTRLPVPGHPKDRTYPFGVLWSFAYKVVDSDEEVVIATTRPETMLGDTAVAVHPEDPRYKHMHGKMLQHPFVDRQLPIITDAVLVDMSFGTGAVKVTPAHDPNDFLTGKRHGLEFITIFNDQGAMNEKCGQFSGMMRMEARQEVIKKLKEIGLYKEEKDNKMRVPLCSRTKDVIEPMLKPQWWVNCNGMAKQATDAVRSGELKIIPDWHKATWFRWLDNIRDWCISRQLWWGHRIPAYFVKVNGEEKPEVVAPSLEAAYEKAMEMYECTREELELQQDPDVLDTWFSSGLFPFSPLGWPDEESPALKKFHPTTLLETGHDILFFWVARMVMCSLHLTKKLPFTEVYLHAMVRDKYGRKMSKSLGNVIDPLEVTMGISLDALCQKLDGGNLDPKEVEKAKKGQHQEYPQGIPECGSDALRFGLLAYTQQGRDVNLDVARIVGYRNFCNKLWNATRFALLYLGESFSPGAIPVTINLVASGGPQVNVPQLADAWILHRLHMTIKEVNERLLNYDIGDSVQAVYDWWYKDLCDVYLEAIKPVMQADSSVLANAATKHMTQTVLYTCLHYGLRLLHPFMPFVTEELYQRLALIAGQPRTTIMLAEYPEVGASAVWNNPAAEEAMETLKHLAASTRALRSMYLTGPKEKFAPTLYLVSSNPQVRAATQAHAETLLQLGRSSKSPPAAAIVVVPEECTPPKGCAVDIVDSKTEIHIMLKGVIDFKEEMKKLWKKETDLSGRIKKLQDQISAPQYADKAPADKKVEDAAKMEDMMKEAAGIESALAGFSAEYSPEELAEMKAAATPAPKKDDKKDAKADKEAKKKAKQAAAAAAAAEKK